MEFGGVDSEDGMLIAIWDWLFTRRIWTETERLDVFTTRRGGNYKTGLWIILKDQFGNVKIKKVR